MLTLAQIIRRIESADGKALIRFEPGCWQALTEGRGTLYALHPDAILAAIQTANLCSPDTARMIFATSWGDYQDMGFEIYGELCVAPERVPSIRDWLEDEEFQDYAMAKWCNGHGFRADGPLPSDEECARFARLYNGPGAVEAYVAKMKAAAT